MPDLPVIDKTRLPLHIAIIMDGNGRWAKEKGEDRLFGHYQGCKACGILWKAVLNLEFNTSHFTLSAQRTGTGLEV